MKENFEFELFIHEGYDEIRGTTAKHERLRRLYFSTDDRHFHPDEMVATYFELLNDHSLADLYNFDMRGFNRERIKDRFRETIASQTEFERSGDPLYEQDRSVFNIGDIVDVCEDIGGEYDYEDGDP